MHHDSNLLDRFGTRTLASLGISHINVCCPVVELALELQSGRQINHLHSPTRRPPVANGGDLGGLLAWIASYDTF